MDNISKTYIKLINESTNNIKVKAFIKKCDNQMFPYNVQIWKSTDNGATFYYAGIGKYVKTIEDGKLIAKQYNPININDINNLTNESVKQWLKNGLSTLTHGGLTEKMNKMRDNMFLNYHFRNMNTSGKLKYKYQGRFAIVIAIDGTSADKNADISKNPQSQLEISLYENQQLIETVNKVKLNMKDSWTETDLVNKISDILLKGGTKLTKAASDGPADINTEDNSQKTETNNNSELIKKLPEKIGGIQTTNIIERLKEISSRDTRINLVKGLNTGWNKLTDMEKKAFAL